MAGQGDTCVVATGARTAVGLLADSTAAAVRAGISRVIEHPRYRDKAGEAMMVALDTRCAATSLRERLRELAKDGLEQALAGLPIPNDTLVPVFLATAEPARLPTEDVRWLATALTAAVGERYAIRVTPVPQGHAAGFAAIARASAALSAGTHPLAVVVGVDSYVEPEHLEALDEAGRLASTANRWGFAPGEACGAVVLAPRTTCSQLRRSPLATVRGVAQAIEPAPRGSEEINVGEGLSSVFRELVAKVQYPRHKIERQYCDLNGEPHRSEEFMYSTQRVHPNAFREIEDFIAPADCWGDVGAAIGPLLTMLATTPKVIEDVGPHLSLLWTCSEGALRSGVLLDVAPSRKPVS